uniref:Uncharacterized protein n=1 Tax=Chromera velia CCMP2878 TaxID=1169474 RepID=A0A0G4ICK0_9ALVE|eukprot:Cvel_13060.t1-p1 / transcript=Cvel_13060.t1 / gene=Cvel_13060 / organism=Chromera_velia_CCMP2878 / gene_product=hypothetical protein / transcript_product=hypothetical protein / location=Cvel_scaffold879:6274-8701(-) / protein_length=513 / sequence_SO=supercontig / SO=protein_coding / is_pseudo=false
MMEAERCAEQATRIQRQAVVSSMPASGPSPQGAADLEEREGEESVSEGGDSSDSDSLSSSRLGRDKGGGLDMGDLYDILSREEAKAIRAEANAADADAAEMEDGDVDEEGGGERIGGWQEGSGRKVKDGPTVEQWEERWKFWDGIDIEQQAPDDLDIPTDKRPTGALCPALIAILEELAVRTQSRDLAIAERAWKCVAYFPSIFLRTDRRGRGAALAVRRRRVMAFWKLNFTKLIKELREDVTRLRQRQTGKEEKRGPRKIKGERQEESRRHVKSLIADGALSKAISRLESFGVAKATLGTFQKLKALNPPHITPYTTRTLEEATSPLAVTADLLLQAARSALRGGRSFTLNKDTKGTKIRPIVVGDVLRSELLRGYGLTLNLGNFKEKSAAYSPSWSGLQTCPLQHPAGLEINTAGYKLMGAAGGEDSFVGGLFKEKVGDAVRLGKRVEAYGDPQGAFFLFRYCVFPKLMYLTRVIGERISMNDWGRVDREMGEVFSCIMHLTVAEWVIAHP